MGGGWCPFRRRRAWPAVPPGFRQVVRAMSRDSTNTSWGRYNMWLVHSSSLPQLRRWSRNSKGETALWRWLGFLLSKSSLRLRPPQKNAHQWETCRQGHPARSLKSLCSPSWVPEAWCSFWALKTWLSQLEMFSQGKIYLDLDFMWNSQNIKHASNFDIGSRSKC